MNCLRLVSTFLVFFLFKKALANMNPSITFLSFADIAFKMSVIVFLIGLGLQTVNQIKFLPREFQKYHGTLYHERLPSRFRKPYQFAMLCHRYFPGQHTGEFITDFDLTKDPDMVTHRILAYYLYPVIDIRDRRAPLYDCVVIFKKKQPRAYVPEGFEVLFEFDQESLLAVRRPQSAIHNR